MDKKDFLDAWIGSNSYGQSGKWRPSDGSSLKKKEKDALSAGSVVVHEKRGTLPSLSKVFAKDEEGILHSVIILTRNLKSLKEELHEVGYIVKE